MWFLIPYVYNGQLISSWSLYRAALEAKAKLYDKLSKGEGLLNSDNEDDEDGEDGPKYMVDFQRKIYEEVMSYNY